MQFKGIYLHLLSNSSPSEKRGFLDETGFLRMSFPHPTKSQNPGLWLLIPLYRQISKKSPKLLVRAKATHAGHVLSINYLTAKPGRFAAINQVSSSTG